MTRTNTMNEQPEHSIVITICLPHEMSPQVISVLQDFLLEPTSWYFSFRPPQTCRHRELRQMISCPLQTSKLGWRSFILKGEISEMSPRFNLTDKDKKDSYDLLREGRWKIVHHIATRLDISSFKSSSGKFGKLSKHFQTSRKRL